MPDAKPRGARGAFVIGVLVALGIGVYLLVAGGGSEADYATAVGRFGQERIDRLVAATLPLGIVKHCHDRFGEDTALIDAVAAYNVRNQQAMADLVAELEATGTMTNDEKRAIEETVMRMAEANLPDRAACDAARADIAGGALDLAAAGGDPAGAQGEGN